MVVRGISDVPKSPGGGTSNTETRHKWTEYAATVAAVFLERFITHAFPTEPGTARDDTSGAARPKAQFDPMVFGGYRSHFVQAAELPTVHAMNDELFQQSDLVPRATLELWWRVNTLTIRLVFGESGQPVGYWNVLPFTPEAFRDMVDGRLAERDIDRSRLVTYGQVPRGSVYLYVTALAARESATAQVVLDLLAFLTLVDEVIGIDGIAALAVSDGPLNLMEKFGMTRVGNGTPQVWALRSRDEVIRALRSGRRRLNELRGLLPVSPPDEEQTLRDLLQRPT